MLIGPPGLAGRDGRPGPAGLPGESGIGILNHGYFITRHSQTALLAECPFGTDKMWDGYSLLYLQGNERAHGQDLGKS